MHHDYQEKAESLHWLSAETRPKNSPTS